LRKHYYSHNDKVQPRSLHIVVEIQKFIVMQLKPCNDTE